MYQARFISIAALTVLTAGIPTFGQTATLRLVASQSSINSGGQVTVEAFISNLPVALRGYEIGLDITGGTSGQITAAQFEDSVVVDFVRADWVFREVFDAGVEILSAGDQRFPPRLFALILPTDIGAQPANERYLGTFVLEASADAAGVFEIAFVPSDPVIEGSLILIAAGVTPPPIPATTSSVTISVQFVEPTCVDSDGDGYGFPGDATCPNGPAEDCNDGDALINPGAVEIWYNGVDQNCDGLNDFDQDGDGFVVEGFDTQAGGSAPGIGDCDDLDGLIHPGANEIWYDGVDQNCDGLNDFDQDGDGFVCDASSILNACPGVVGSDCDDTSVVTFPGAAELCDGLDNDCDGQADEGDACGTQTATLRLALSETAIDSGQQVTVEAFISNLPVELHGYQIGLDITGGTSGQITAAQFEDSVVVDFARPDWVFQRVFGTGVEILSAGDQRFPPRLFALIVPTEIGAQPLNERYLGTFVLEASPGAAGDFQIGITPPDVADSGAGTILIAVGGSAFPADVDDPSVIPVASVPVTMSVVNVGPTCVDVDGDGYGSPGEASCPNGPEEDCNDGDEFIHPGADEVWYDGIDQNCDGLNDFDQDADGFVVEGSDAQAGGSAPGIGDCDDTNATVHPGAVELCDELDNDCNGEIDDSPNCVIPAVSEWGLTVMILLVLTAGTVVLGRRGPVASRTCP